MKRILLLLFFISTVSFSHSQNRASDFWQGTVAKKLAGVDFLTLQCDVTFSTILDGVTEDSNTIDPIIISSTPHYIYQKTGNCISLLTADSLFMYYFQDGNFTYGRYIDPQTEMEKNTIGRLLGGWFRDLDGIIPFYINPRQKELFDLPFSAIEQVDSNLFKLTFSVKKPWTWTDESGNVISSSEILYLWVDKQEMLVTKARRVIHNSVTSMSWDKVTDINISHISFEKPDHDDAFFRRYITEKNECDVYNINQGQTNPSEAFIYVTAENTDKLLDAPLVNIFHDTVTIRQLNGWVLIDIWQFGCKPCARFHKKLSDEQDSLGYRILEHKGINILCLNPLSLVTESFVNYSKRFRITDIAYSAKSILGSLNWYSYPYYLLISPDKKIVYKNNYLETDYQDIFNAINEYEKQ